MNVSYNQLKCIIKASIFGIERLTMAMPSDVVLLFFDLVWVLMTQLKPPLRLFGGMKSGVKLKKHLVPVSCTFGTDHEHTGRLWKSLILFTFNRSLSSLMILYHSKHTSVFPAATFPRCFMFPTCSYLLLVFSVNASLLLLLACLVQVFNIMYKSLIQYSKILLQMNSYFPWLYQLI